MRVQLVPGMATAEPPLRCQESWQAGLVEASWISGLVSLTGLLGGWWRLGWRLVALLHNLQRDGGHQLEQVLVEAAGDLALVGPCLLGTQERSQERLSPKSEPSMGSA